MAFPPSFLDDVRGRLPLDRLVGRKVRLAKAGRDWKGLCPFHNEKTPSFHVFADHYHCYGCGAHGDHFRWVMETEKASFPEAVERLAGEAGLEVPRSSPQAEEAARRIKGLHEVAEAVAAEYARRLWLPEGAAALAYLRRRGLSDETIQRFRLGWSGEGRGALAGALARQEITPDQLVAVGAMKQDEDMKAGGKAPVDLFFGRVMFPIWDARGRVIAFGGRVLGDGVPKYVNSPETALFKKSRTLYGAHLVRDALRAGQRLAVVEGYMDVIALAQAGHAAAVAPLGTALTEQHLEALWRLDPCPVLCFDGDAAGARAAERVATIALPVLAPGQSLAISALQAGDDPDTFVRRHGADAFASVLEQAVPLATQVYLMATREAAPTPELKAAQKRRLEDLAASIADPKIRTEYRRHFDDAWYSARRVRPTFAGGTPPRRVKLQARPALSSRTGQARFECSLVEIVLRRPSILAHRLERFAAIDFADASAEAIRAWLCANADHAFGLDSRELIDQLRQSEACDALVDVRGRTLVTAPSKRRRPDEEDPLAVFDAAVRAWEIKRLEEEILDLRNLSKNDPCDATHARLTELVRAWERAVTEDERLSVIDGTDAAGSTDAAGELLDTSRDVQL